MRCSLRVCAFVVASAIVTASANPAPAHPPDPFSAEYVVPTERELGSTAAQLRFVGGGAVSVAGDGMTAGLQGTIEVMTVARIGVRGSLQADVVSADEAPWTFAARVGPSLHLLPYRRVDLSLFVEGGAALVSPPGMELTLVPTLSPGIELDVWVSPWWFLSWQGQLDWHARPETSLRATGIASLGLAL